ncbi:MAG: penicillin-binding protein [Kofleriaceae bacterium]
MSRPTRARSPSLTPPLGAPRPTPPRRPMTPGISRAARARAYVAGGVLTLGLFGVGYKAYGLQVVDGERYREAAERQHVKTVRLAAPRGEILDAHGRALAVTADADSVWANPREVADVAGTAERLAALVGGDVAVLESRLAADKHFTWIARQVTPEIAEAVRDADLPGVEVSPEPRRWYPGGAVGGPVVGRANIDGVGLDGIELAMNDLLAGRRAAAPALRDAHGHTMMADGLIDAEPGATVQLTLDRTVQAIADGALGDAVKQHKARAGVAVVLDVASGAVLAMSSMPTFDPNEGVVAPTGRKAEGARNRAITDAYEIGSSMKVFSIAAALDAGVTRPDEWWDLGHGSYYIAGKTIRDTHHDASLTTAGVIKRSSNVGAVKIAMRLGRERLGAALARYGFGTTSGIELPGEVAGRIREPSKWRDIELATIAFGYGLTVTPLQLAAAVAMIGADGLYREPRIVARVTDAAGAVIYTPAPASHQAMKPATARALRPILASVFDKGKDGGTAASIDVPGFRAGGKTGTAHKWDASLGKYSPDRYYSSFVGLAPIDAPRIAVVVMIDEPSGGDYFGGKVAGPVFATIASDTLRYLGVPGQALPAPAAASSAPTQQAPTPPPVADDARAEEPVPPTLDGADGGAPDLRGLGLRRALDRAAALGVTVAVTGTGTVVTQEPAPGQPVDDVLRLTLSDDPRGGRAVPSSAEPES